MFESAYIKGATIPAFDSMVSELIDEYGIEGGGKPMRIAVENFEGKVYRAITSVGLAAFMHVVSSLQSLKMKDVLADSVSGKDGYDSWFVPTQETKVFVVDSKPVQNGVADDIIESFASFSTLSETERESLIQSRVGQGVFRQKLIEHWGVCAVTGAACIQLLRASHIKPWRDSSNVERLDPFNGLLLSPNIDAAFDAGFITFDNQGKIVFSNQFSGAAAYELHISQKLKINPKLITSAHTIYLEHHRNKVFRG